MRAGKIDVMDSVAFSDAQNMLKTNPEIMQVSYPNNSAATVGPKNDVKPFSDINVREAMQMAIDLPTIAKTYYAGTASPYPSTLTSNYFPTGWGFPYSQWPAALQAQYAYNPTAAKQLLTAAGYPNGFNTDCVADIAADPGLLQIVQSYLAAIGINMSITTMDSTSWTNLVLTQHKQDAFAYRASGLYGLTYQPVRQITAMLPGNSANYLDVTDPNLTNYENQIVGSTTTAGLQQTISNLNQYIAGQHYVICLLQQSVFGIYQPWLKGYDGRYLSISGAALGPQLIGFYGARFWIDQNVKKSFGQ